LNAMTKPPFEERWPRPSVMGVVNVTPDSFSDGGLYVESSAAVEHARRLLAEGAALVDVGGESTRPGAAPVSADEELARVLPVLEGLAGLPISIDTSKALVAGAALGRGAQLVNDVTALRGDPAMVEVIADADAYVCLMHMQGSPRTMQVAPSYDDVVGDVFAFLEERVAFAVEHGVREDRICVDPGIGFGKTPDQNLELLRCLDELKALGRPVLVGVSRKSTLEKVVGDAGATRAGVAASVAAAVAAFDRGATMIRAHDVGETVEALAVAAAVERGKITA
ncbi:MAG TPA: dihydropteroate synthase, partial [Gaiellaceae bacterium]|nr:dihydropteroate synthase [Gaiellaceae bacterium]